MSNHSNVARDALAYIESVITSSILEEGLSSRMTDLSSLAPGDMVVYDSADPSIPPRRHEVMGKSASYTKIYGGITFLTRSGTELFPSTGGALYLTMEDWEAEQQLRSEKRKDFLRRLRQEKDKIADDLKRRG